MTQQFSFKDGSVYVSCCPIFDVYSQGDTEEEARKNLNVFS